MGMMGWVTHGQFFPSQLLPPPPVPTRPVMSLKRGVEGRTSKYFTLTGGGGQDRQDGTPATLPSVPFSRKIQERR